MGAYYTVEAALNAELAEPAALSCFLDVASEMELTVARAGAQLKISAADVFGYSDIEAVEEAFEALGKNYRGVFQVTSQCDEDKKPRISRYGVMAYVRREETLAHLEEAIAALDRIDGLPKVASVVKRLKAISDEVRNRR